MRVVATSPSRIGLVGGGTDVEPFASQFGGKVLSAAINLVHTVVLEPTGGNKIVLAALGEQRELAVGQRLSYSSDPKLSLYFAVLNHFRPHIREGFSVADHFDGRSAAGLGSSGSAAVAMIGALSRWLQISMSRKEIAMLAWRVETRELGWVSGKQDQLAAAFGGINVFGFGPGKRTAIRPLLMARRRIAELREWIVLCLLPGERHSDRLQRKLVLGMEEEEKRMALVRLREMVDPAVEAVRGGDWERLGRLLHQAWEEKKRSNPAVANAAIERVYRVAREVGALGGKVMGAGGTGHLFFLAPPRVHSELYRRLVEVGLEIVPFDFDFRGLRVKVYRNRSVRARHRVEIRRGFAPKPNLPAVFLDRDGVVSREWHLVFRLSDFALVPGAAEAVRELNRRGIPVVLYHNASVVARGMCGEKIIRRLHEKMNRLLAKGGARVDVILYCPHHPMAFHPAYAVDCSWRKPGTGMPRYAASRFGFNLGRSFVVGDNARDMLMGKAVGARTILVETGHGGRDTLYEARPDAVKKDIVAATKYILERLQR